jgi:hypothetical protein
MTDYFNQPIDHAWRKYRAILKDEGLSPSEMYLLQEAFKQGWYEGEASGRAEK